MDRRTFLGRMAGVSTAALSMGVAGCAGPRRREAALVTDWSDRPKDTIKVGFVGIGNQGSGHVRNLLSIAGAEIRAVCDIRPERTEWAKQEIVKAGFAAPTVYGNDDLDFRRMCEEEDLDLVYNAAPWRWHTPICVAAMENGKHAASEVNIALSIEDCWRLVETAEKTRKQCIMMENCCYDHTEMMVMNMIRQGLFGEVLYGECGYLHDLRALKLSPTFYQGMWRVQHSVTRNGNLYPTHGIGPLAWCMDINRGDALDTLVAMSSASRGLQEYARKHYPDTPWAEKGYALGDVNVCMINTKQGKTLLCKHNTNLPRPYSRDFLVQGTQGIVRKYPEQKIHIEGRTEGHNWDPLVDYTAEYEHPVWKSLREVSEGAGHGGMDYIEDYRLIQALRQGILPDIDVYDSVVWSAIIPLSEQSVAAGGEPVPFPDFMRGQWRVPRTLAIFDHLY